MPDLPRRRQVASIGKVLVDEAAPFQLAATLMERGAPAVGAAILQSAITTDAMMLLGRKMLKDGGVWEIPNKPQTEKGDPNGN